MVGAAARMSTRVLPHAPVVVSMLIVRIGLLCHATESGIAPPAGRKQGFRFTSVTRFRQR